jgi:membrane-bound serine protease (ClpP class)
MAPSTDPGAPARATTRRHQRRVLLMLGGLVATLLAVLVQAVVASPAARAASPHIDSVTFQREVDPAAVQFLSDAIDTAEHDGATLLVINEDTPGGDLDSMNAIVQKELASTVPIAIYVSPEGGHAASAGTVIALAAPIVAMAPNTRIGAASPVDISGQNLPSTLATKIQNDLEAELTSLQTTFHRNVALALQTVSSAASFDADQASQQDLVNYEEPSLQALLNDLNGSSVTLANGTTLSLTTAGEPVTALQPTFMNQLETVFFDPNVLFLLFIIAAICIFLELSHPGAIVPGTVGAIALILFLLGAQTLSPNWAGLALMLLAIVLLAVDVRVPTHGVLSVAALVSLVVGALIFFDSGVDSGAATISPLLVFGAAAGVGLVALIVIRYAIRSQRGRVETGGEGLIGQTAIVTVPLAPYGRVKVLGEDWAAELTELDRLTGERVEADERVQVIARDGLKLIVEPLRVV